MSNESEKALPICDFLGIDRTTNTENVPPGGFYSLQNLYEREIDTLEKRGGSQVINQNWPSNIIGINNITKLYDRDLTSARILGVQCKPPTTIPIPTLTGFSADSIAGTGHWNESLGGGPVSKTGTLFSSVVVQLGWINLQFVGFGINFYKKLQINNYNTTNRVLQIVIPSGIDANITGINLYSETLVDGRFTGSVYGYLSPVWFGYIDLIKYPNGGTFNFVMAPRYWDTTNIADVHTAPIGDSLPQYTLKGTTGGTLIPGKTYYVAVMTQVLSSNLNGVPNQGVDYSIWKFALPNTIQFPAITLGPGETAIIVEPLSGHELGTTSCYAIAVGTDPSLLTMQFITNNGAISSSNTITDLFKTSPNLVVVTYDATNSIYKFLAPDYSIKDMLIRLENDTYKTYPIFVSGITDLNQVPEEPWGSTNFYDTLIPGFYFNEWDNAISGIDWKIGDGNIDRFTQLDNQVYFVNDAEVQLIDDPSIYLNSGNGRLCAGINKSGLYATDGYIASAIVFKYGTTPPPKAKFITTYQESLVTGGGSGMSDSYDKFYFSQTLEPYDFSQSSGAAIAYVEVGTEGDPITGFGVYSYTHALLGPVSQLIVGKKNSTWVLSNLPTSWTTKTSMTCMSQRVGISGETIINTDIGCIFSSKDNVYMFSNTGEPQPIGDSIHNILKEFSLDTMSKAQAVYHDQHYKLTFSVAGETDSIELWLDIKKMKALKGKPVWKGPMIGRRIDSSNVEYLVNDPSTRVAVDRVSKRVFESDVYGLTTDFGNNIVFDIATAYHPMAPAVHMKKLYTRCYWKMKTMMPVTFTEETLFDDGRLKETQTLTFAPPTEATWSQAVWDNILFRNAWYKIYASYPKSRLTGVTIRKRLVHSGIQNIAISAISPHFKLEKRRVT